MHFSIKMCVRSHQRNSALYILLIYFTREIFKKCKKTESWNIDFLSIKIDLKVNFQAEAAFLRI